MDELTGGRAIVIYGQTEVVKDLIAARLASGLPLHFETGVESRSTPTGRGIGQRTRRRASSSAT